MKIPGLDNITHGIAQINTAEANLRGKINNIEGAYSSIVGVGTQIASLSNVFDSLLGGSLSPTGSGTLYSAMTARPDPMLPIDWQIVLPLGLDWSYIEEIQVPQTEFSASPGVFRGGNRTYFVGIGDTGPATISFYEDRLGTVTQWLHTWRGIIQNVDGSYNLPATYKKSIYVIPTDVKGNPICTFTLEGTFPTQIPSYTFNSNSSERISLPVTFSVDRCRVEVAGGATPSALSSVMATAPAGFLGGIKTFISGAAGTITSGMNTAIGTLNTGGQFVGNVGGIASSIQGDISNFSGIRF